ncbi:MAG TPA: MmcQ/YjbR family DNA-binding protein [Acidimicrobiales bacterium]|nr:MmcQ/YjbR family DNA-binding protein [Acidimicrobiales bacterium]
MAVRQSTVRRLALALPDTAEAPHHEMTSFRVAGKIFATVPPEGDRVHVFVGADEVSAYCAEYPGVVEELWWGKKLSGCRVTLRGANQALLRELLTEAWRNRAPHKLLARFDEN